MKKPSFFERLTGAAGDDGYGDVFEDEHEALPPIQQQPPAQQAPQGSFSRMRSVPPPAPAPAAPARRIPLNNDWQDQDAEVGELAVDVYQTQDHVVVKALVAGVIPANLDLALTREMLTIRGTREDEKEVEDDDYFQQELYWGPFARTILLPEEVDVDAAEATEKHGILIIRLPKVNKARQAKLRVKTTSK
jgi:HSP20 family protein